MRTAKKRKFPNKAAKLLLALLVLPAHAHANALTTLKQVQVANDSRVDLLFDAKVSKSQVKTEFFNDIVQISLTDAAVYPAKISAVSGNHLSKIFAYQYAPKLVRCRLTVKGKAEDFKDRIQIVPQGKILSIRIDGVESDRVALQSAAAERAKSAEPKRAATAKPAEVNDAEEKALLERVLKASQEESAPKAKETAAKEQKEQKEAAAAKESAKEAAKEQAETKPSKKSKGQAATEAPALAGGKNLPNPMKAFGKLALVLGLFLLIALGMKKLLTKGSGHQKKGVLGAVSRFAQKSLGTGGKMIQVVSTHNLGPKKSIVVVRVAGRLLVLGIANDSINLITQLNDKGGEEIDLDDISDLTGPSLGLGGIGSGATAAGSPVFSDLLASENGKPSLKNPGKISTGNSGTGQAFGGTALGNVMANAFQSSNVGIPQGKTATQQRGAAPAAPATGRRVPGAIQAYGAASSYAPQQEPDMSIRAKIRSKMEGLKPL